METYYMPGGKLLSGVRVIVRDNGRFTDDHQYAVARDGENLCLRTIEREDWTDDPLIMDVQSLTGIGRLRS